MKNDSKFLFENRFKKFVWKSYDVIIVDEDYVRNNSLKKDVLYVIAEDSKVIMLSSGIIYWVGDFVRDEELLTINLRRTSREYKLPKKKDYINKSAVAEFIVEKTVKGKEEEVYESVIGDVIYEHEVDKMLEKARSLTIDELLGEKFNIKEN